MDVGVLRGTEGRFDVICSEAAGVVDGINSSLMTAGFAYLASQGFVWIDVPELTKVTGACENVNTLYAVDHFGQEAYLAQTGQLYLEAKIPLHDKVWTLIKSSRAETAVDGRHLNQFPLLEFEHRGGLDDLIRSIEGTVKAMLRGALASHKGALMGLNRYNEVHGWAHVPFSRMTYTQAVEMLGKTGYALQWGDDLTSEHEHCLTAMKGRNPVFVTHYPKRIKFFNMRQNDENPEVVNSTDLLMPYSGESVGAAERENDAQRLRARLLESPMFKILVARGKGIEDFAEYLALVEKHPALHSGCGIGFSRVSQAVLGVDDIRMTTNYPLQRDTLY